MTELKLVTVYYISIHPYELSHWVTRDNKGTWVLLSEKAVHEPSNRRRQANTNERSNTAFNVFYGESPPDSAPAHVFSFKSKITMFFFTLHQWSRSTVSWVCLNSSKIHSTTACSMYNQKFGHFGFSDVLLSKSKNWETLCWFERKWRRASIFTKFS